MGFLRDLLGPRQPCDLCQLGQAHWPVNHAGSADWKIRGAGLSSDFLICPRCVEFISAHDLSTKNPIVVLSYLVLSGNAERPAAHVLLNHAEWRKVCMHAMHHAGVTPPDEFGAVKAISDLQQQFEAALLSDIGHVEEAASSISSVARNTEGRELFSLALNAAVGELRSLEKRLEVPQFPNKIRAFRFKVDLIVYALLALDMVIAKLYASRASEVRDRLRQAYEQHVAAMADQAGIAPELGYEIAAGLMLDRFNTYVPALQSRDNDRDQGLAVGAAAFRAIFGDTEADVRNAAVLGVAFFEFLSAFTSAVSIRLS